MYFRRVLVCETWEFKAFTFSKWSTRRTLKEKMRGFSLPPPLWTWSWTLWGPGPGCSDDAGRRLSGAFPLDSSVIKPQCSEQSCHKPLREIKLPPLFFFFFLFWLDIQHEDITQGKLEVLPPRLSGDSNYVPLWPCWWPFKLPHFSSFQTKIVWGYPCFWGASVVLLLTFS